MEFIGNLTKYNIVGIDVAQIMVFFHKIKNITVDFVLTARQYFVYLKL